MQSISDCKGERGGGGLYENPCYTSVPIAGRLPSLSNPTFSFPEQGNRDPTVNRWSRPPGGLPVSSKPLDREGTMDAPPPPYEGTITGALPAAFFVPMPAPSEDHPPEHGAASMFHIWHVSHVASLH